MNIPKSFETAIENTFYDKKISVLEGTVGNRHEDNDTR